MAIKVTVDAIALLEGRIVLIDRKYPPHGIALPGGHVDEGESLEQAIARELKEETGLHIVRMRQFHTYSDPSRDKRGHSISTVFLCEAKGDPRAADDAKGIVITGIEGIDGLKDRLAFDHYQILCDARDAIQEFLKQKHD